jgi:DNA-binding NarL/FixJ family response regulator
MRHTTVLLADDHPMVAEGLAALLRGHGDLLQGAPYLPVLPPSRCAVAGTTAPGPPTPRAGTSPAV